MLRDRSNIGLNLCAINKLLPNVLLTVVEINKSAAEQMSKYNFIEVINDSVLNYNLNGESNKKDFDLVFTMGVLIHINPNELKNVYEKIYNLSTKYILVAEYYNPQPVEILYRGYNDKLFKRDFAGELMNIYPDLKLINYGFCYHKDNVCPMDDITWFLLSKN